MSLPAVLANTQTPHQPFLLLLDTPTFSGFPVFSELISRAIDDDAPIILISVLHPPSNYSLRPSSSTKRQKILDLTSSIPGFPIPSSSSSTLLASIPEISKWATDAIQELGRGVQVFVEGLDVLAEDYDDMAGARSLVKAILASLTSLKAPSRLTLLLPSSSPLLPHLTPPSISPTLSQIHLHPSSLISHLSSTYLLLPAPSSAYTPSPSSSTAPVSTLTPSEIKFQTILRTSAERGEGIALAYAGEGGVEVSAWNREGGEGAIAEVLVRKAVGGAGKGMSRSLEGIRGSSKGKGRLEACAWEELKGLEGLGKRMAPAPLPELTETKPDPPKSHPSQQHIPFNLSLTPSQEASRASVPIPYAHEGDEPGVKKVGGARIEFEPGSEDDMDDDDPDEDLDF